MPFIAATSLCSPMRTIARIKDILPAPVGVHLRKRRAFYYWQLLGYCVRAGGRTRAVRVALNRSNQQNPTRKTKTSTGRKHNPRFNDWVATVAAALFAKPGYSQTPISQEKVTIRLGYQPLTPSYSATIITGAKLWKPYLPNVEVERFDTMSGMPLVNNMLAGRVDIAIFGDMPSIVLASKSQLAQTRLVALIEADQVRKPSSS